MLTILLMITLIVMVTMTITDSFSSCMTSTNADMIKSIINPMFNLSLSKYVNVPSNWIMTSMIIYLLVTLIAVMKITNISYGPLRQKFYWTL